MRDRLINFLHDIKRDSFKWKQIIYILSKTQKAHKRENNIGLKYDTSVLKNQILFLMLAEKDVKTFLVLKSNVQDFVFALFIMV